MKGCWLFVVQDSVTDGSVYVVAPDAAGAVAAAGVYLQVKAQTPMTVTQLSGDGFEKPALLVHPDATRYGEKLGDPRPKYNLN